MKKEHQIIHIPTNEPDYWWKNLYILSDEDINEGDWFINLSSGGHPHVGIYQANSENSKAINEFKFPEIRKIIASTNPKLIESGVSEIPTSFIEEYCKAGGIDKVMVEYDDKYSTLPNKFIIIHPVEEKMYTEQDLVKSLVGFSNNFLKVRKTVQESEAIKWIKENL